MIKRRLVARRAAQLLLDRALVGRVERRRRLVEDDDRRIFQQRARDRHTLLLAARQLEPALADRRVVALRRRRDELVDLRRPRGRDHLVAAGARPAVCDVVFHRVVEQHRVLRNDADRAAQARLRHVAQVLAVDRDAPDVHVVEAIQQPRERALARARRPDHRDRLCGRDFEAHVGAGSGGPARRRSSRCRSARRRASPRGPARRARRPLRDRARAA